MKGIDISMKRASLFIITLVLLALFSSCASDNASKASKAKQGNTTEKNNTTKSSGSVGRISFDTNDNDDATYKQHIEALWEKTKALLREDISKNYSDQELKELGTEIDTAWVNLQMHCSINHMDEIDKIKDARYANIIEDIMGVIDELYANRYTPSEEKRKERMENLKNGRLEFKIKEFDETLKNAN